MAQLTWAITEVITPTDKCSMEVRGHHEGIRPATNAAADRVSSGSQANLGIADEVSAI